MTDTPPTQPPGWYYAQGDPPGTQRYWDGTQWQGAPQPVPAAGMAGQAVAGGPLYASAGLRIGARFIDLVIYFVISLIISAIFGGAGAAGMGGDFGVGVFIGGIVSAAVVGGIEIYLVANGGQSLGKKMLSTKVVKDDGSEVDMDTSLRRFGPYAAAGIFGSIPILGLLVSLAIMVVGLVSFIFLFTKDDLKTLWDNWANTIVVKA